MADVPRLVCERCDARDATVAMRRLDTGIDAPLCDSCAHALTGANEPGGELGWLFWVFLATLVGFAVVVAIAIVLFA